MYDDVNSDSDNVKFVEGDITSQDTIDRLVQTVKTHFGRLDALILNAG